MKYVKYNHPKYGEIQVPVNPPLRETGLSLWKNGTDYVAGVNSKLQYEVVCEDWRVYSILNEKQYYPTFDTFACTNFADNNAAEIQLKHYTGEEFNFSDRASAVLSGTQPGIGNNMSAAPERARKFGRILEKDWPNEQGSASVTEWYKSVPKSVQDLSVRFKEAYEWVDTPYPSLGYHLKHAPVTIAIKAGSTLHDVTALFIDSNGIWYLDSYPHGTHENHLAITTQVPLAALKIITKPMNTIYFVHRAGTSEYGLLSVSSVGQQYVPASTEADLIARGGVAVPLINGKPDYSKAREIELP